MPVSWRIEKAASLVVLTSDEQATFDEWCAAVNEAIHRPEWHVGMRVLHDARRMARVLSAEEAESRGLFVSRQTRAKGIARWAVVVSTQAASEGALQFAAMFADRNTFWCRVFEDPVEAEAWAREAENRGDRAPEGHWIRGS